MNFVLFSSLSLLDIVRDFKSLSAEVIYEHFFKALERVSQVQKRLGCLVNAWVEYDRLDLSLEVVSIEYKLTV